MFVYYNGAGECYAWTFLNAAVPAMDQNFVEVLTKFSADLHPSTLRNVTRSFQSILDDLLLTYRERLGGIVLGYHDERIVSKTAAVNAFYPYFHVDAEATLSVLRLEEDKHLGVAHSSIWRCCPAYSLLRHVSHTCRGMQSEE